MGKRGGTSHGRIPLYQSVLLAAFLLYSVIWGIVVLLRYYSYNAGIFDLGLSSTLLYRLGHSGIYYIVSVPTPIPLNKLIAVVLAVPYLISYNAAWLVVFQSVWIGAGVFPLYRIAKRYVKYESAALMLAISYLLYYPLAGVNWFDFHFMAIFPTAFLLSVMFNMEGKKKAATVSGTIAVISDFLIPLTMLFYVAYCLAEKKHAGKGIRFDSYLISMTALSLAVLAIVNVIWGTGFTTQYFHLSGATYSTAYIAPAGEKLAYFYAMLLPVLFLSIFGLDFLAVGIPFFALAFMNTYEPYVTTMYFQYPALIAPIIFISAAVGLGRVMKLVPHRKKDAVKAISAAILLINVVLFSFFSPIGNIYTGSVYDAHYGKYISGNSYQYSGAHDISITRYDHYLAEISGKVPLGSSILIQNNMPQMTAGYNWELPGFRETGFVPQYVLIDPYSAFYNQFSAAYHTRNSTMAQMANEYVHSGNYSIAYSMDGIVLLSTNYTGNIVSFIPLTLNATLTEQNSIYPPGAANGSSATFFEGSLPFLEPGIFILNATESNESGYTFSADSVSFFSQSNLTVISSRAVTLPGGIEALQILNFSGPAFMIYHPRIQAGFSSIQVGLVQASADKTGSIAF